MDLPRRTILLGALSAGMSGILTSPVRAGPGLVGPLKQGGLIIGRLEGEGTVALDDKPLRLSKNRYFAFGFGRDQGKEALLSVTWVDGKVERIPLAIEQREYQVQKIDGLPDAMVTPPAEVLARIKRDNALIGAARARDTEAEWFVQGLDWPLRGPISGVYGSQRILNGEPRRPHFGVDIAAPEGSDIHAPMDAIVAMAEPDLYYTGATAILDHGHGISTSYLHMSRMDVKVGDRLARGDVLGAVGKTGRATGPHLCWRLNWFQERLDPQLAAGPMPS
ncbi:MAG: M23 family metallopeptidase [Alphaproteobacteria bacterium]|nr:M23 family metallopeptidase [Alphaproteobacteria bacterium]